ncbi:hypothetical protein EVA_15466 [gut metagenome]|uniref:Uncharacterized protein n=1 Tax=gut metagenome TaxID=749906 RepID=J9G3M7_9ZZZZ
MFQSTTWYTPAPTSSSWLLVRKSPRTRRVPLRIPPSRWSRFVRCSPVRARRVFV